MALKMKAVFVMGFVAMSLVSVALASAGFRSTTFYTQFVPSACYGNQGTMIAAASDAIWNNGAACGRIFRVTCTSGTNNVPNVCKGGSVTVKVVDRYPLLGCKSTMGLSQEAFSVTANPDAGIIYMEYDIDNGAIYNSDDNIMCVSNSIQCLRYNQELQFL